MSVVNTNMSASLAQAALAKNERALGTAMEQLSTGSKINSAADDAAGLAMASKFTAQIKGLDMAVKNASDAISMISTAEGALDQVDTMLQRMRELAVQSSNGTVTAEDRDYMDLEYQALDSEITRVAKNTQWNGENLLDGKAGKDGVNGATSSKVTFQISANFSDGTPVSAAVKFATTDVLPTGVTTLYSDGTTSAVTNVEAAAAVAMDEVDETGTLSTIETALGTGWSLKGGQGSLTGTSTLANAIAHNSGSIVFEHATSADITVTFAAGTGAGKADVSFAGQTAVAGNTALSASSTANDWKTALTAYNTANSSNAVTIPSELTGTSALTSTDKVAAVTTAIPSNDVIEVDFGNLKTDMTSVASSDIDTQANANSAIATLDTAIKAVNTQRATFGSASNRLEHAVDNMTNIQNNAEASRSRIEDTDYAETTSELAKAQIIAQAGTAMLAQANQSSQSVLSLLR